MAEPTAPTVRFSTPASSAATGVTTREQSRKNTESRDANDDADTPQNETKKKPDPPKEIFKGWTTELKGNVFQLAEEGRKGNQFTTTLEALKNYANIKYDHAMDLAPLFKTPCTAPALTVPADEPPMMADGKRAHKDTRLHSGWVFACTQYNEKVAALRTNQLKLFTVILLQCSMSVKAKLEASTGYEAATAASNCLWILTTLRNICHKFEHTEYRLVALIDAKTALLNYKQSHNQTTTDYFETFKELLSVLESYDGVLHDPPKALPDLASTLTAKERETSMRDRYSAVLFLSNADSGRYEPLKHELANAFAKGRNEYPTTLSGAHQLLSSYKSSKKKPIHPSNTANQPARSPNKESGYRTDGQGRGYKGNRNKAANAASETPPKVEKTFTQIGFSMTQVENHFPDGIPSHFILLDSDSTVSIFCNHHLLTDIHTVTPPLHLETNGGGRQLTTQKGTVPGFGEVWYNPASIANILSLAHVRQSRRVTMDTNDHPVFHVHKPDGTSTTVFHEHPSGLYLHDASAGNITLANKTSNSNVIGYSYLQTVAENKKQFTKRQVDRADDARKLYRMIGRPSQARFITILRDNLILNCPITPEDAQRAESIYGKDIAYLKGKTSASQAKPHAPDSFLVPLPLEILNTNPDITLCADLFYILGHGFCLTTSRNLHYLACHPINDRSKQTLQSCLASDISTYSARGFSVRSIHADSEFHPLRTAFPDISFNICAVDDHVPAIERSIRTVKDTVRSIIHGLPFKRLPRTLLKEIISYALWCLNSIPHPDGVSPSLSPATIVRGTPKTDYNSMKIEFGSYVQVYDGTSNDTKSRTLGAIATTPTGNSNGDYYFMSLTTGQRIHRRSWTLIPLSDSTISRVEAIAFEESMPLVDSDVMINEYNPSDIIDESAYDKTYQPPLTDSLSDHHLTSDAYTESDDDSVESDSGHHAFYDDEPTPVITEPVLQIQPTLVERNPTVTVPPSPTVTTNGQKEERANAQKEERANAQKEERVNTTTSPTTVDPPVQRPLRPGLRNKHGRDYTYKFGFTQIGQIQSAIQITPPQSNTTAPPEPTHDLQKAMYGLLFTQMSAAKGIKKHGQTALNALKKEFIQFRNMDVLEPLDAFKLTEEQKSESLRAISVIKEKRDGSLKGRTCADGSMQQGKFTKAQTGSPTISNDALFMTVMIDAHEKRDVATADVTGAYLHAHMKDFISMRFTGWAVDLLREVNPEYSPFVVREGNVSVLYVRCNKAIYGCVVSGVLWYELFSETLEKMGFIVNPYDFCVANAIIEGSQCTIGWFVDDTKISHVNPSVVTSIVDALESKFGKMTVTRGNTHEFLGMTIHYAGDGTASIHMPSYIKSAITDSGLDISKAAPSPCANNLLIVDTASPQLDLHEAQIFHSVVAKLIYVGTRARTDILLALAFLCSRVAHPTLQDQRKLKRLLEYLYGTIDLPLRIGADSLNQFATWVDASFAVHEDMRSHTGGAISFGRGAILCKSKKQSINTKSSTEAELIGASDYLPNTLYVKLFMEAQGYPITQSIFHQDNESAIKMESNGKASCGQRSRHIDIRYFFITDHSKRQSITIQHCPTADMLADFFTKPLQGIMFRRFRAVLLGETHIDSLLTVSTPEQPVERVGINKIPNDGEHPGESDGYRSTHDGSDENTSHSIEKYPEE